MKVRTDWKRLSKSGVTRLAADGRRWHQMNDPFYRTVESPLNGFFSSSVRVLGDLRGEPFRLCRDGALPLRHFFRRFPTPKSFEGKILVHEDLRGVVPLAWRPFVGTYRFFSKSRPRRPKDVFIYGINSECFLSRERCELLLPKELRRRKDLRVFLYLSTRSLHPATDLLEPVRLARMVLDRLPARTRLVDWPEADRFLDWKSCRVIGLNKTSVLADDWLLHAFAAKGAAFAGALPGKDEEAVMFSAFHGAALRFSPKWPRSVDEDLAALLGSPEALRLDETEL